MSNSPQTQQDLGVESKPEALEDTQGLDDIELGSPDKMSETEGNKAPRRGTARRGIIDIAIALCSVVLVCSIMLIVMSTTGKVPAIPNCIDSSTSGPTAPPSSSLSAAPSTSPSAGPTAPPSAAQLELVVNTSGCTTDTKLCTDMTSVERTGPNCEFQACPTGACIMEFQNCPDGSTVGRTPKNDCEFAACPVPQFGSLIALTKSASNPMTGQLPANKQATTFPQCPPVPDDAPITRDTRPQACVHQQYSTVIYCEYVNASAASAAGFLTEECTSAQSLSDGATPSQPEPQTASTKSIPSTPKTKEEEEDDYYSSDDLYY